MNLYLFINFNYSIMSSQIRNTRGGTIMLFIGIVLRLAEIKLTLYTLYVN